jgi:hypothetical protein
MNESMKQKNKYLEADKEGSHVEGKMALSGRGEMKRKRKS